MFAKSHPEASRLDDTCFLLDGGALVASDECYIYVLDPDENYSDIRVYPRQLSSKVRQPKHHHQTIGVAGSDPYQTLPVDPNQLYPTYPLAVAAAVRGRRANPDVDLGILIYFPQNRKNKPNYLVSPHYNGGIWRDDKHCFTEQISETHVAYLTDSDFGLVKSNAHIPSYGPIIIGHIDRFRPPGRISSALVAYYRFSQGLIERFLPDLEKTKEESKDLFRNFHPALLNNRKCRLCNTRKPGKKCNICLIPYCDKECQKIDWPRHKKECKQMASARGLQLSDPTGLVDKSIEVLRHNHDVLRMDEHFLRCYQTGIENRES
jgi:hypothetical protein